MLEDWKRRTNNIENTAEGLFLWSMGHVKTDNVCFLISSKKLINEKEKCDSLRRVRRVVMQLKSRNRFVKEKIPYLGIQDMVIQEH